MIDLHDFLNRLPRKPRDFQREAVVETLNFIGGGRHRKALIVAPTGAGKGDMIAQMCAWEAANGRRVLVITPRKKLVSQLNERCHLYGVETSVEMAGKSALKSASRVVVASAQTLAGKRLERWAKDTFDTIIFDECHHVPSPSNTAILDWFTASLVGLTATPYRHDGKSIADCFDYRSYEMTMHQGASLGLIVPFELLKSNVAIDLRALRAARGDFDIRELSQIIEAAVDLIAESVKRHLADHKAIVFVPRVFTAELMAGKLNQIGVKALAIDGAASKADQEAVLAQYEHGDVQVLCNSMLLTEGFDSPRTDMIVLARPTKSTGLLAQMIGRAARLYPGKTHAVILDFDWQTGMDDIARVEDIIYENKPGAEHWREFDDVREREDDEFGHSDFSTYEQRRRAAIMEAGEQILALSPEQIQFKRDALYSISTPITVDAVFTGWDVREGRDSGRPYARLTFNIVSDTYAGTVTMNAMLDGGKGAFYGQRALATLGLSVDDVRESCRATAAVSIIVRKNGNFLNVERINSVAGPVEVHRQRGRAPAVPVPVRV